jgi:hypothetical protein
MPGGERANRHVKQYPKAGWPQATIGAGQMEYLVAIEKGETVPPPISKSESLGFGQHNQRWQHAAQSN